MKIDGQTKYYSEDSDFTTDKIGNATEITLLKDVTSTVVAHDTQAIEHANVGLALSNSCTLDLNGKTLTFGSEIGILVKPSATSGVRNTLTLQDSGTDKNGTIVTTWDPGDVNAISNYSNRQKSAIKLGYSTKGVDGSNANTDNTNGVGLIMLGGTIDAKSAAICAGNNSSISIQDGCEIVSQKSAGIYFGNSTPTVTGLANSLTMTGGSITSGADSNYPAIQVSGTVSGNITTTLTISGGKIAYTRENTNGNTIYDESTGKPIGDPLAIYASGNTQLNISGGEITSTGTGVELKRGGVAVTGGTIESTATNYNASPTNSTANGATTFGAAIAISANGDKIDVKISGDSTNITGANALSIANPNENPTKVTATIDGGKLESKETSSTSNRVGNAILADSSNVVITVNNGNLNGNVTVAENTTANADTKEATIVMAGGTTTGTVKVVTFTPKTDTAAATENVVDPNETDEDGNLTAAAAAAKSSLKVMGTAKVTNAESAKNYVASGYTVKDDGTTEESSDNGWKVRTKPSNAYDFVVGTASLLSAASVGNENLLKYDRTNRLIGIANGISYSLDSADTELDGQVGNLTKKGYYLANFSISGGAVSIRPLTEDVRITGTGFIDSKIVTLTTYDDASESLGIVVDATDNNLAYIKGGKAPDSIKAGARNTTLNGGDNNDTLEGGSGDDLFIYTAGNDVIANYTHGTDTVSLSAGTAPVDFGNVNFDGTNLALTVNGADALTFKSMTDGSVTKNGIVYSYQGHAGGGMNYIAIDKGGDTPEHGISLGGAYSDSRFNGTTAANEEYATIDAAKVTGAIRIIGNDNPNYIVGGIGGGTLEGGEGKDILNGAEATASLVLNGGDGDDSLIGGNGYNVFVYTEGSDSISGYKAGNLVTVRGGNIDIANAAFSAEGNNISLDFGGEDRLIFENISGVTNGVSLQSGRNTYIYTKETIALENKTDKGITLTSGFSADSFAAGTYDTINAVAVGKAISLIGNDNNNVIFGSSLGGNLYGGAGNDKLDVTERANNAKFVLKYTEGKDTVSGFVAGNDKLDITAERLGEISKAKSSKSDTRLAFTFDKSNVLTFTNEDEVNSVLLNGGGFLTKDGVVSIPGDSAANSFKLFESTRGRVDLTEAPYAGMEIKEVNAENVKKQSVTLVGGTDGGQFTFAGNNKKKDQFEYNGGNVTISGYEAGKDRLDLNTAALTGFSVGSEKTGDVSLTTGLGTVVLEGMKEKEVLLHHAESKRNSFTKMVFKDTGVILNKEKRPTAATVSGNYNASDDTTVKKIFVADGADNISITAGDRNKTTLDASAANGVSLIGGAKNDKLIGNTSTVAGAGDTFIYAKGGKDIIQNYSSNDQISLGDFASSLTSARINAGKRSIKFKFSNKNALTIKPTKGSTLDGALNISGLEGYTYAKNAIVSLGSGASGGNASLTSEFNGSYRLKDSGVNNVDGSRVEKNLTYRGTSADETLSGGTKKTTFKGGGGNDAFTGGSGNDVFFYAKGDKGDATIADFDFNKDKLKIASGTITNISKSDDGKIQFNMNSGKKGSANIGSFKINSSATYTGVNKTQGNFDPNSTLIKANNTYYWFAKESGTDASGESYAQGALITSVSKVSKSQVSDYAVIDLGYSSNLVNAGVATKVSDTFEKLKPTLSGGQS